MKVWTVLLLCFLLSGIAGAAGVKKTGMTTETLLSTGTLPTTVTKTVYLTFDDGPSDYTEQVLDTLKKYGVPGTFFVTGNVSSRGAGIFKRIVNEGHALGNHSFSHNAKNYKNPDDFMKDLAKQDDSLSSTTGLRPRILRFPYGSNTSQANTAQMRAVIAAVLKAGYAYFDWTADSKDWHAGSNKETVLKNIIRETKGSNLPFAIVLMHDTKKHSMEALPSVIDFFKKEGYRFEKLTVDSDTLRFTTIK